MGTVVLADVTELTTVKISELDETLSTGNDDDVPIVKDSKTQRVKKPNLVHTQNTDTKLDEGGANEISVTEIPKMATADITYYVATNGDDSNPGTDAEPFATIQHAVDLLPKELNDYYVAILLKDGIYEETVSIKGFSGGVLDIYSDSWNVDNVLVKSPVDKRHSFDIRYNSAYILINGLSIRVQKDYGNCVCADDNTFVDIYYVKMGDNGNLGTRGVFPTGSKVSLYTVADIDANKVSTGIRSGIGSIVTIYDTPALGDIFADAVDGGIITDGIRLIKADYDDAITKKHTQLCEAADFTKLDGIETGAEVNNISDINATDLTDGGDTTLHDHDGITENTAARHAQNTDTALGAQSENLDMNTHKIINVVDPIDDQDAMTKLFASNMAINGGVF